MSITLTITGASPDEVVTALAGLAGTLGNAPATTPAAPKKPKATAASAGDNAAPAAAETSSPAPGATEEAADTGSKEPVTLEALRILVQKHMDNKKQPELRQVFADLGVKNVSGLTKAQYETAYEKLNAIV